MRYTMQSPIVSTDMAGLSQYMCADVTSFLSAEHSGWNTLSGVHIGVQYLSVDL